MENKQERETVFLGQGLAYGLCIWVGTQSVRVCVGGHVHVCGLCVFMEKCFKGNVALRPLPTPSISLLI